VKRRRPPAPSRPPRRATIPLPIPAGAHAKVDADRVLAGFYRPDQVAGRPAKQAPLETYLRGLTANYRKQIVENERAVAKAIGAPDPLRAAAGQRSTAARQERIVRIEAAAQRLLDTGTPPKNVAAKVAAIVGVSARHVRRVLKKKRT
jgi:hypothetical protein